MLVDRAQARIASRSCMLTHSGAGGGLGGLLTGELGDLLKQFQGAGKGDIAKSLVGAGQNQPITPADFSNVLTPEQINFLMARTGLSREELLVDLSDQLPKSVDHLTPRGPPADTRRNEPRRLTYGNRALSQ
jgi:uncharacterized protein YidB (DUF937 family)